jgi:hypothetical protein
MIPGGLPLLYDNSESAVTWIASSKQPKSRCSRSLLVAWQKGEKRRDYAIKICELAQIAKDRRKEQRQ